MKTVRIIGQPKPEPGWVHRFRNFGEEIWVRYRVTYDVSIEEIDRSFDAFDVRGVADDDAASVAAGIEERLRDAHHLDDAVVVRVSENAVPDQTVIIVLDPNIGDQIGEIAWKHPLWVTPGGGNRALIEEMWAGGEVNKLLVYGPPPTPEIERALNEYDFGVVIPTACGFIAMKNS